MAVYGRLSDQELSDLLQRGDTAAFTEIYDRYSGLLYIYAYKLTADAEVAKDLTQEMFISLWDKRKETDFTSSLRAWLYCGVRYKFLKLISHQKVRQGYADRFLQSIDDTLNTTEHYITEKELIAEVEKLVLALPPKMARVFILSKLDFKTYQEIAEELGVSEKTVQNLLSMAVKKIKPGLERSIFSTILL